MSEIETAQEALMAIWLEVVTLRQSGEHNRADRLSDGGHFLKKVVEAAEKIGLAMGEKS